MVSKLTGALGLMSGTSLDGIDVAFVRTDGEDQVERGPFRTYPYSGEQSALLRRAIAQSVAVTDRTERPADLRQIEEALTEWHAAAIKSFCQETGLNLSEIVLIGFHGQTVLHRPETRLTVQLGDGPALARVTGRPVIYDMRAADIAAGGQGAPLVPVYHRALAGTLKQRPVAFVNIGGVANVTWIGRDGTLLAFDTGPGNALIDDWMLKHARRARDEGGALAATGRADLSVVAQFTGDHFFENPPPKSLDRNTFASLDLRHLSPADGAATLVAVTAQTIAMAGEWFPEPPESWIICGGGRHNTTLMRAIRSLATDVLTAEQAGFDGDAMEAEAWAYLAVRSLRGLPLTFPGTTGVREPLTGGVVAMP